VVSVFTLSSSAWAFVSVGNGRGLPRVNMLARKLTTTDIEYDGTHLKELLDNVDPVGSFATAGTFDDVALAGEVLLGTIVLL